MSDGHPEAEDRGSGDRETLLESLRREYGSEVDPRVTLERGATIAPKSADDSPSSPLLARMGSRPDGASRYRLDGEIARGGMGAILAVWDEDLRRRLAMKVALGRDGEGSSRPDELEPRVLARFLEEAQVTGQLEHPGVVPVHELGIDPDGRVFFTMRLVRGDDLEHVLRLVDRQEQGWSRTRALGVLLKACEAMAFAHDKGVIHRDLKPGNVMVGPFGEVYVMDWGLARVQGHADRHDLRPASREDGPIATDQRVGAVDTDVLHTMDGDVIGTPAYMPPEQARGELENLDERADVYAMGAMLYRLLAGAAPYTTSGETVTPVAILERLFEGPPDPLIDFASDAPPALVAITEKAMAREPVERYENMLELAEDLRAFLEGRVVSAYETGALAEARMWVRRNKPLAASIAAGLLALVAGLVSSVVLKSRADESAVLAESRRVDAERTADLAESRRQEADRLAVLAEQRRGEAEESAELAKARTHEARRQAAIAHEVNRFLNEGVLAAARPDVLGFDVTLRDALEVAEEQLDGRTWSDPTVEAEVLLTLGETFAQLSMPSRAFRLFQRALDLYEGELGERHEDTLRTMGAVAAALSDTGELGEALELYEELYALYVDESGADSPAALATKLDLARVLMKLGELQRAREEFAAIAAATESSYLEQADSDLAHVLDRDEGFAKGAPSSIADLFSALGREMREIDERLAGAHVAARARLGRVCRELADLAASEEHSRFALGVLEAHLPESHSEVIVVANDLALCLIEQARYAEAQPLVERALAANRGAKGPDHDDTLIAMSNLADLYLKTGRLRESEDLFEEVVEAYEHRSDPDPVDVLRAQRNLAAAYSARGRTTSALRILEPIIDTHERILGPLHPETLVAMNNLANALREQGRLDESESVFRTTIERYTETLGPNHPDRLMTLENLGNVLYTRGEYDEVVEILHEVLAGRRAAFGEDHPDVAKTTFNLGLVLGGLGRAEESRGLLEDALRITEASLGELHPLTASILAEVGDARLEAGEHRAAAEAYARAAAILDELGHDPDSAGLARHQHAYALMQAEDWDAAVPVVRDAHAYRVDVHGADHSYTLATHYLRVAIEARAGDLELAEELGLELHRLATESGDATSLSNASRALRDVYNRLGRPDEAARW